MNLFGHPAVGKTIDLGMIDTLIAQVASATMPRVRDSAVRHLYSAGATLKEISNAYLRDLEAGDRILSQRSDKEQNTAPETQKWLEWLRGYEAVEDQLRRISLALSERSESEDAA